MIALVALASASGCGRSRNDEARSPGAPTGGRGATGGVGGSTAGGGFGGSVAGRGGTTGGTDVGNGGCTDSHADCACDSTEPVCASAIASFCASGALCPPTEEGALDPASWPPDAVFSAILMECDDGVRRFDISHFESGSSFALDAEGKLIYEAQHSSCNEPICGAAPPLVGECHSCRLAPVDAFPRAGEGGQGGRSGEGGEGPNLGIPPPCELDENGTLVMPAK